MNTLKSPRNCSSLNDVRVAIDSLDWQILEALRQRLVYVRAAARFKPNEESIPAPERVEAMLVDRRRWAMEAGFDTAFSEALFQYIIEWNIQQQILHWRATLSQSHERKEARA